MGLLCGKASLAEYLFIAPRIILPYNKNNDCLLIKGFRRTFVSDRHDDRAWLPGRGCSGRTVSARKQAAKRPVNGR